MISEKIYIYGAGVIGNQIATILHEEGHNYDGFVVSNLDEKTRYLNMTVYGLDELTEKEKSCAFLIAVNHKNEKEIRELLQQRDFRIIENVGQYTFTYYLEMV